MRVRIRCRRIPCSPCRLMGRCEIAWGHHLIISGYASRICRDAACGWSKRMYHQRVEFANHASRSVAHEGPYGAVATCLGNPRVASATQRQSPRTCSGDPSRRHAIVTLPFIIAMVPARGSQRRGVDNATPSSQGRRRMAAHGLRARTRLLDAKGTRNARMSDILAVSSGRQVCRVGSLEACTRAALRLLDKQPGPVSTYERCTCVRSVGRCATRNSRRSA